MVETKINQRIAVIVASHGEVEEPSIKAFNQSLRVLFHHVSDVMPIPAPVQTVIAAIGSVRQTLLWRTSGYRSRYNAIARTQTTLAQAELTQLLARSPLADRVTLDVKTAYDTTPPYTDRVMAECKGYDGVVIVPMNPIDSDFSCGLVCRAATEIFPTETLGKIKVLSRLWDDADFIQLSADHLFESMPKLSGKKTGVILVMHGTIVKDDKGKPPLFNAGLHATETFAAQMKAAVIAHPQNIFDAVEIGYLNHGMGGTWTSPTLKETLAAFRKQNIESVVMFPFGYYADNSETDHEANGQMQKMAFKENYYINCLNESPAFAAWLARRIWRAVEGLHGRKQLEQLKTI
jgi:ferrochelatase